MFVYKPEVDDVCTDLVENFSDRMTTKELSIVQGIQTWANKASLITLKQLQTIGRLSYIYPQEGVYIKHGWWPNNNEIVGYA